MRWIVIAGLALAACGGADDEGGGECEYDGHRYGVGQTFPAIDGCNQCTCQAAGAVSCTEIACVIDAGPDADPASCLPSGGCAAGPSCGGACCDSGEACVGGVCRCGSSAACGPYDTCEAAGPVGTDACGSICCGDSGPCPQ